MEELIRDLYQGAKRRWHTRTGLVSALAFLSVSLIILFAGLDLAKISVINWVIIALILGLATLTWHKTRIKRARPNHIGFGVAIEREDGSEVNAMYSDFIASIRTLLSSIGGPYPFQLVEVPVGISSEVKTADDATRLAQLAKLHFLVYGRARVRKTELGDSHVIDLQGLVRHATVDQKTSKKFSKDFSEVLPRRFLFKTDESFLKCECAAKHVGLASEYVIAVAAALSGDFKYSERLLQDTEQKIHISLAKEKGSALSVLLGKTHERLRELYFSWLGGLSLEYLKKRDKSILKESQAIVERLRKYDPNNYSAHLTAAMALFVLDRDVAGAMREIRKCKRSEDATWLYSRAFLEAYGGDLAKAYLSYLQAFARPLHSPTVPTQSEEFIHIVLEEEPHRPWLYFCLGLINQRAKADFKAAEMDFNEFIERADKNKYAPQIRIAEQCVKEIQSNVANN